MLKKSHVLALGVATAGLIGFAAPMASAATVSGPSSLVNVSNNQVPIQLCGNDVYGNVLEGAQLPVEGDALVASLLSPGSVTKAKAVNNRGCTVYEVQQNGNDDGGSTLLNVAGNQIPIQVCGNDVFTNGTGTQTPLYGLAGAIVALSPAAVTKSTAVNNRGCESANDQQNGHRDWMHQPGHRAHGKCPCHHEWRAAKSAAKSKVSRRPVKGDPVKSNVTGHPVNGDAVNSNIAGHPVNGDAITSGLAGLPVGGGALSGLQGSR